MATLKNEAARGLGLPGWRDRKAMVLEAGVTIEVPDEYVAHLRAEVPGVAAFFDLKRGGIRVAMASVAPRATTPTLATPIAATESIAAASGEPLSPEPPALPSTPVATPEPATPSPATTTAAPKKKRTR